MSQILYFFVNNSKFPFARIAELVAWIVALLFSGKIARNKFYEKGAFPGLIKVKDN